MEAVSKSLPSGTNLTIKSAVVMDVNNDGYKDIIVWESLV